MGRCADDFPGHLRVSLDIVVSRLIAMQREQIAALKAFGYTRQEIGWHYVKLVLLIVVLGSVAGTAVGSYLGHRVTRMYAQFFHFAVFAFYLDPTVAPSAIGVSTAAAVLGTLTAVCVLSHCRRLRPCVPSRPHNLVDSPEWLGFDRYLAEPAKMISWDPNAAPSNLR